MKRSRPDLYMAVSFLTTRVLNSDIYNWGKLRRILRFFHCTFKEEICFGATKLDKIFMWVDASYAILHGTWSNTGCVESMGLGVTHCRLSKQKMNTKSST